MFVRVCECVCVCSSGEDDIGASLVLSDPRTVFKFEISTLRSETSVVEHEIEELPLITSKSNSWFPCSGFLPL